MPLLSMVLLACPPSTLSLLMQAGVAYRSPLIGKTVRELHFRTRYNAAVVAVHRDDARIPLRIQDIVLQVRAGSEVRGVWTDSVLMSLAHGRRWGWGFVALRCWFVQGAASGDERVNICASVCAYVVCGCAGGIIDFIAAEHTEHFDAR